MVSIPSILLAIGGSIGTGKTTLAYGLRKAVPAFHDALVLEGDQVRREILGYELSHVMIEADYAPEVSDRVRAQIVLVTVEHLKRGYSVIDASGFWTKESQNQIETLAKSRGVKFIGLWLNAPRELEKQRITKRLAERNNGIELSVEKGHASDACLGVFDKCDALIEPPTSPCWHMVDAGREEALVLDAVIKIFS